MSDNRAVASDGIRQYFSDAQWQKIRNATVAIAGAGGLGSNIAMLLVRSGINRLRLVDFDTVAPSNLNRQFFFAEQLGRPKVDALAENLRRIAPDAVIETSVDRITPQNVTAFVGGADVVVEAFDKADAKALIVEAGLVAKRPVFAASGLGGIGASDRITVRHFSNGLTLIGDGVSAVGADVFPYAPRVTVAAAKVADEVLAHILGASGA